MRALALVVLALALAGCREGVDLDATRALAKTAADLRVDYDALATDFYDSCMRRLQLDSISDGVHSALAGVGSGYDARRERTSPAKSIAVVPSFPLELSAARIGTAPIADIARLASDSLIASFDAKQYVALVDRDDFAAIEALFSTKQRAAMEARARTIERGRVYGCRQAAVSSQQWRTTNDILLGYFVALGELAGPAGTADDRYGIGALAAQLHASEIIPNDPAPLAGAISGLIRGHFDAKRRGALLEYMTAGAPLVDDAVKRLRDAAREHYVANQLRQERDSLETFLLLNRKYAKPGADAFAVYAYAKAWKDERRAVDDREIAANAYIDSLAKLGAAHESIVRAMKTNDVAAALGEAIAYATAVRGDVDAIDNVFGKKK